MRFGNVSSLHKDVEDHWEIRRGMLQLLAKPAAWLRLGQVDSMAPRRRTLLLLAKPAAQERPYPVDNKGSW